MNKIELNISEILNKAWEPTKKYGIIIAVLLLIIGMVTGGMEYIGASTKYYTDPSTIKTPEELVLLFKEMYGYSFTTCISNLINVILSAGLVNMVLSLVAGRMNEVKLSAYNMPVMTYVNYLVVNIIYGILIFTGTLLCVIPGIFIAVRLSMAQYHVIEHPKDGIIGALKSSWEITKGNFWNLFLIGILYIALTFAGLFVCCVGAFFAVAYFMFINAIVYFTLYNNSTFTPEQEYLDATVGNESTNTEKTENGYNKNY